MCGSCGGAGVLPERLCADEPFDTLCPSCEGRGKIKRVLTRPPAGSISFAA